MGIERGGRSDTRQRRAFQKLGASPLDALGIVEGGGIDFDFNANTISIGLSTISGLEFDVNADLRIDIGQTPSILLIDANGLKTQYIVTTGAGADIGVSIVATGLGSVLLSAAGSSATCSLVNGVVLFGAGATQFQIDATIGLTGLIDVGGSQRFRIEDSATNTASFQMDFAETFIGAFFSDFVGGSSAPIRIQPYEAASVAGTISVIAGDGAGIQGALLLLQGGKTSGVGAPTAGGPVTIRGGIPESTGNSQISLQVQDATPTQKTVVECGIDGAGNSTLGFYGTAPIAKQLGVLPTAPTIHAALVALGLIT